MENNDMVKWIARKYIRALLNSTLNALREKTDLEALADRLNSLIGRLSRVSVFLLALVEKCRDGEITEEELEDLQASGSKLIEEVSK